MSGVRLVIDASAGGASVALLSGPRVLGERTLPRHGSAEALAPAVDALLREAGVTVGELAAIVVGAGPGSFTGLRVVAALAKGMAWAAGRPLQAVNSLALIAAGNGATGPCACVLDALRGEWYLQRVDATPEGAMVVGPVERLARADAEALAVREGRQLLGPVLDPEGWQPHARGARWLEAVGVDLAAWEPDYGRLAEAQVVWEAAHGRPLPTA